jgi:Pectate lyase superfamily protein
MGTIVNGVYLPSDGESGWGDEVNDNFRRLGDVGVNVKAYGAVGNGSMDDTTAIGNAIAAVPEGGTVFFPPGHYVMSTLTVTKNVTLQGAGWWNATNNAFGHTNWGSGQYGTLWGGTVLRSTNTTTRAILFDVAGFKKMDLRNFMLVGPGTGTSNGIEAGSVSYSAGGMFWQNILVANFGGAGYRMRFTVSNVFTGLQSRGCKTGFSLSDTANDNQFFRTEVQFSDTDAVLTGSATAENSWYGGLIQNCTTDGFDLAGTAHHVDGFYFENTGITKAAKLGGTGVHTLTNCYMSTADEDVDINAANCVVGPLRHGAGGYVVTLGTASDITLNNVLGATITTNGNFYSGLPLGRAKTQVVATGSLPAANAAWDGYMIIEDNGTGDRNFIIYAGGQRFRIDGGAAF